MLSSTYRFHGHASVRRMFQHSQTFRGRSLMMRVTPNKKSLTPRVAVIVSKKVFKSAVKRNRIRRRIFEIVRRGMGDDLGHTDMVFTVFSPDVLCMPHDELAYEVNKLLTSATRPESQPPKS